jgi:hypothetical protein
VATISDTGGSYIPAALLSCTDDTLYDLTHDVSLAVIGGPRVSTLVFGSVLTNAPGSIFAASIVDSILYQFACALSANPSCTASAVATLPWGNTSKVQSILVVPIPENMLVNVWASTGTDTAIFQLPVAGTPVFESEGRRLSSPWLELPGLGANTSAFSATLGVVALGNESALTLLDATTGAVVVWDWVTDVAQGWGAPIDSPVTALAFAPDGTLYIGNAVCLNIRFVNGTYARIDGPAGDEEIL